MYYFVRKVVFRYELLFPNKLFIKILLSYCQNSSFCVSVEKVVCIYFGYVLVFDKVGGSSGGELTDGGCVGGGGRLWKTHQGRIKGKFLYLRRIRDGS